MPEAGVQARHLPGPGILETEINIEREGIVSRNNIKN
jgi:hypothetical protein